MRDSPLRSQNYQNFVEFSELYEINLLNCIVVKFFESSSSDPRIGKYPSPRVGSRIIGLVLRREQGLQPTVIVDTIIKHHIFCFRVVKSTIGDMFDRFLDRALGTKVVSWGPVDNERWDLK